MVWSTALPLNPKCCTVLMVKQTILFSVCSTHGSSPTLIKLTLKLYKNNINIHHDAYAITVKVTYNYKTLNL